MYNRVILLGNLTKDIELKYIPNGTAIASSSIATSRKFTTSGDKKEEVCFIDITFFGKTGEIANQYLKKGSRILIEGRLKFDTWQDQNGQTRSKHSVVVDNMQMLGNNQGNENFAQQNYSTKSESFNQDKKAPSNEDYFDKNNFQNSVKKELPSVDINSDIYDDEEIPF